MVGRSSPGPWPLRRIGDDVAQIVVATPDPDAARDLPNSWTIGRRINFMFVPVDSAAPDSVPASRRRASSSSIGWLAVHDAARPLISQALIDRTFQAALLHGAAAAALPVHLTIKQATGPLPAVRQTLPATSFGPCRPPSSSPTGFARRFCRLQAPARADHRRHSTSGIGRQAGLARRGRRTQSENHHPNRSPDRQRPPRRAAALKTAPGTGLQGISVLLCTCQAIYREGAQHWLRPQPNKDYSRRSAKARRSERSQSLRPHCLATFADTPHFFFLPVAFPRSHSFTPLAQSRLRAFALNSLPCGLDRRGASR